MYTHSKNPYLTCNDLIVRLDQMIRKHERVFSQPLYNIAMDEASEQQNDNLELTTELVQSGAEIAGSITGAAIGLMGGPAGALGGAALGVVVGRALSKVGADIQRRLLGPREQTRIGAALAFATTRIANRVAAGHILRQDQFFTTEGDIQDNRPPAEELLEGILLKARDAYEEKKVPLIGSLFANVGFHPEISPIYAGYLIKLAGELSYNQLVALAVGRDVGNKSRLRNQDYRSDPAGVEALGLNGQGLLTEIYDLYQRGLVNGGDGSAWLSVPDVVPTYNVQGAGGVLASLMSIDSLIPQKDREIFYTTLHP